MADNSEEKPSDAHDVANTKSAIFDTLNQLKKWRQEKLEECRKSYYLGSERSLELTRHNQEQLKQLLENSTRHESSNLEDSPRKTVPRIFDISPQVIADDLEIYDTPKDSSISGHLQRCLNDSSQSNISINPSKVPSGPEKIPVFSEFRNLHFSEKSAGEKEDQVVKGSPTNGINKPKRPFLKKGSGLLRFMPKSAKNSQTTRSKIPFETDHLLAKTTHLPQKVLKLKPAIRKTDARTEKVKHIRFDIVESDDDENIELVPKNYLSSASKICENIEADIERKKCCPLSSSSLECSSPETSKENSSNSESESLVLSESKELEEFELLENCAQNSSFNSDSSVVQRILQGEQTKSSNLNQNYSPKVLPENVFSTNKEIHKNGLENSNISEKFSLSKCLEEVHARKQAVHKVISEINPRIQSLQKEISNAQEETLDDSDSDGTERCSTPIDNPNLEERYLPSAVPKCKSDIGSVDTETSPTMHPDVFGDNINEEVSEADFELCNVNGIPKNMYSNQDHDQSICNDEEHSVCEDCEETHEEKDVFYGKSQMHKKMLELEKEIETYKNLNAKVSAVCKERDEILRKLQKEREDFSKYKEAEKSKLEVEILEERRQIKRQKETFTRYQKLRKDNPTKKERDELNSLRLEIEKSEEELKRQKIKYTNDNRRWKTRLDAAERERDSLRLENIKLEEQCQDLLSSLKARMKKPESKSFDNDNRINACENVKPMTQDVECQTDKEVSTKISEQCDLILKSMDAKKNKPKVHFDLTHEKKGVETTNESMDNHVADHSDDVSSLSSENNLIAENIKYDNAKTDNASVFSVNLSVISVSAEAEFKEVNHKTCLERIYPSGERELFFKNGTHKKISADGKSKKVYFYNGDVKEINPDCTVYKYINGVIEKFFPDGKKTTEFPDGHIQYHYPNEKKEIRFADHTVYNIYPNGSEKINSANGITVNCIDGSKVIEYPNGQKEIRTSTYTRREFPDGSVKISYHSGRQETRYSDGRVRIKDKEGKILFDTKYLSVPQG